MTRGEPALSIRRVHAEPESDLGAPAEPEEVGWLALWDDRSITYHRTARALLRAVRQRDRRDAARAERRGDAAIIATVISWNRTPPGFVPAHRGCAVKDLMIDLRGQRVTLTPVSYMRGWIAYQGGDYFEFHPDGAGGWMLSQSAEWDYHDPSHVVGRGVTLQAAAEDFTRSVTRPTGPRPGAEIATRRRDLVAASIDDLVSVLCAATRLGYDDGCAGLTARTGNAIAYALGLSCWSGLHQLQLRHAYLSGRQHGISERRRDDPRSTVPRRPSARHAQPTASASPRAGAARAVRAPHRVGRAGRASQ